MKEKKVPRDKLWMARSYLKFSVKFFFQIFKMKLKFLFLKF